MEKVSLREMSLADTENIIKWKNNKNVKKNFCIQDDLTRETHEKWFHNKIEKGSTKSQQTSYLLTASQDKAEKSNCRHQKKEQTVQSLSARCLLMFCYSSKTSKIFFVQCNSAYYTTKKRF